jgi:hypothetical protein
MLYHQLLIVNNEFFMLVNLSQNLIFPIEFTDLSRLSGFGLNGLYMGDLSQHLLQVTNLVAYYFVNRIAFLLILIDNGQGFTLHE